jgi:hypothetical protein
VLALRGELDHGPLAKVAQLDALENVAAPLEEERHARTGGAQLGWIARRPRSVPLSESRRLDAALGYPMSQLSILISWRTRNDSNVWPLPLGQRI